MTVAHAVKRVSRTTLATQVAELIREAILSGDYELGAQLNEMELAAQFGVSRGPVREAMQRLIQEGLLFSAPHRGVFVPELNDTDVSDIYFVRRAVEEAAIRRVMASAGDKELPGRFDAILTAMAEALSQGDWVRVAEADLTFHSAIVDAAGSPRLSRMFATIAAETKLCLHMLMDGYRMQEDLISEHRRLAKLILGDDVGAALADLSSHFGDPVTVLHAAQTARDTKASGRRIKSGERSN
jgi:DNA-binding GntR family transcriptional regulator